MKGKRSVMGMVLTIIGVVVIVPGVWPGLVVESPKPGFGPHQMIAVAAGLVFLLLGALLCAKCKKCASGPEDAPAPPPPPPAE